MNAQTSLFVSTKGNDENPGTFQKPFATLYKARDVVRAVKKSSSASVTVNISGGYYEISEPLVLDSTVSGIENAPVVFSSYQNEEVFLIGGKKIDSFAAVRDTGVLRRFKSSARNFIKQIDLKKYGITEFGAIVRRGFGLGDNISAMELFINEKPMTPARWPNAGWVSIDSVPYDGAANRFYFNNEYINRWGKNNDLWVHGYWKWDWADSYEQVKHIDTLAHSIETYPPHGVYGYSKGRRFYFLNILEEVDTVGEWYLDRNSGMIYFYQDRERADAEKFVSLNSRPLVTLSNVSHMVLKNIGIAYGRNSGIKIIGGSSVTVSGCSVQNVGTAGIVIQGGINHSIVSCTIKETGNEGVIVSGGDRKTLASSRHSIVNTSISRFGRWSRTYHPGISISGVGVKVANNEISDASHSAIILSGNDHLIEYNHIHDVCKETIDAGAIYMGRDLSARGIVIRFNKFFNITSEVIRAHSADVSGIYLDDFFSGVTIYGNIFSNVRRGVEIGCGRDNTVENNIFLDCTPAVYFTKRGWDGKNLWDYGELGGTVMKNLNAVPFQSKVWKERYPLLANILDDQFGVPKGNRVVHNIYYNSNLMESFPETSDSLLMVRDNVEIPNHYIFEESSKTVLDQLNNVSTKGFHPIPLEKISIQSKIR